MIMFHLKYFESIDNKYVFYENLSFLNTVHF